MEVKIETKIRIKHEQIFESLTYMSIIPQNRIFIYNNRYLFYGMLNMIIKHFKFLKNTRL